MDLSTNNYLPLLICISLIVIGATLFYMYIVKKTPEKKANKKKQVKIDKNIEYQEEQEQNYYPEHHEELEEGNRKPSTTEAYTSGTFRIKPKHTMNDEDDEDDENQVLENFNAPTTKNGNVRQSMGDEEVLNSRNPNSLSFIDKLQKRFDSSS